MIFKEALIKLNIEEYGERIFNANSQGNLFHLSDYVTIAEIYEDTSWFKDWFEKLIEIGIEHNFELNFLYQNVGAFLKEALKEIKLK